MNFICGSFRKYRLLKRHINIPIFEGIHQNSIMLNVIPEERLINYLFYSGFALLFASMLLPFETNTIYDSAIYEEFPYRSVRYFGLACKFYWINLMLAIILMVAGITGQSTLNKGIVLLMAIFWIPSIVFYSSFIGATWGQTPYSNTVVYGFYVMQGGNALVLLASWLRVNRKSEEE